MPDRGGWVSSIIFPFASGEREILFQHDYAWDPEIKDLLGGLPFVFPVCARISRSGSEGLYLYDGKQYQLKIHGFSWYEKWTVDNITENSIDIVLRDNKNTLERYPFKFEVRLKYEVLPGKLRCHQIYKNNESIRAMPYYAGFHPYFLISDAVTDFLCANGSPSASDRETQMHSNIIAAKNSVTINFNSIRRLKYNNTLTDIIGEQEILKMPSSITNPEINEQLNILAENKLATLHFPNGDEIKINVTKNPDYFSYLQLYTIPEKPFFCIEHWMSFPNAMNTVSGVRWLKPNEMETSTYEISL